MNLIEGVANLPFVTVKIKLLRAAGGFECGVSKEPGDPSFEFVATGELKATVVLQNIARSEYP
jgi:hypothetical protein